LVSFLILGCRGNAKIQNSYQHKDSQKSTERVMKRKGQKKEAGELKNEKMKKKKKKSAAELNKRLSFLQEVQSKMESQSDTIRVLEEKVRRIEKAEPTTEAEEAAVVQAAPVDVTQEHDGQEGEEKLTDDNAENHAGSSPSPGIYVAIPDEELAALELQVEVFEADLNVGEPGEATPSKATPAEAEQREDSDSIQKKILKASDDIEAYVADMHVPKTPGKMLGRVSNGKKPCKFWLYGSCKKGEHCTWWHQPGKEGENSAEHHSRVPCKYYFSKNGCQRDSGLNLSRDI